METIDLSRYTVLIVDDVIFSRDTVERLLRSMGLKQIHKAGDGAEALRILKTEKTIDFVISDFNMPVMNGLQLLKAVRLGHAGVERALPFAMLTGYSDRHLVDMALGLDVNAFLVKPVSKKTMSQRLEKMLTRPDPTAWVKEEVSYDDVAIVEAEETAAEKKSKSKARQEAIQAMKAMENDGDQAPEAPKPLKKPRNPVETEEPGDVGPPSLDPRQVGRTADVMKRLSSLSGRFKESDLADNITERVESLVTNVGDKTARRLVSYLDGLVRRKILDLDDLPEILAAGEEYDDAKGTPIPGTPLPGVAKKVDKATSPPAPPAPKGPPPDIRDDEEFLLLDEIPAHAKLARDVHTEDGSLLMQAGTELTLQIVTILRHLEGRGLLRLTRGRGGRGVYVVDADAPVPGTALVGEGGEKSLPPEAISAGSVLSRDIFTADGRLYLAAGSDLTERVISILQDLHSLGHMDQQIWVQVG